MSRNTPSSRLSRGFTLVELMVVVIIVGILGTIGIATFRKQSYGSKSTEALSMIQSIRAAEERWKAENLTYLHVSDTGSWYPSKPTSGMRRSFFQATKCVPNPSPVEDCRWKLLNPTVSGPVQFGYMVYAGVPDVAPPKLEPETGGTQLLAGNEHWYVIQATADGDGDGKFAGFAVTTLRAGVVSFNEGE